MADVLIVCVREDEPQAKALAEMFEAAGFSIGGAPSSDAALRSSGAGVVVWSQASIRSRPFLDAARSEERRVGKECRSRWSPCHEKKQRRVPALEELRMLNDPTVTTMLPALDMDRARAFYEDSLGLRPDGPRPHGTFVYAGGRRLPSH